ncbi:glucosyltransferase domain-containing protein [Escherichia coli]|uniref:glucosyltransferase domain-containing protein n=1 Tax=Escherichia coli TaxID=562 RepID=UPI000DA588F8|nr:glucosyltransferase domain-containing protein [Escherichia coli]EKV4970760.1 glucosyltransferase domain-containing protein [Escherichia coli]MBL4078374.1 glucosyltransferase domain-containing protein [Escherichia coli]MCY6644628.1 glucosyltransferase domain-containing protein [Escherichia coli]MDF8462830.1 glucosyltransferase domain-containing protein [Escherichia coli]SRA26114.1 Uncharacterised protein [Escherichia coli]
MFNSKYFYIPLFLIAIFFYPIISADVLYRDDLDRSLFSFDGWGVLGRPLSDFLMHIFSLNFKMLPNAAPMPLLTGVIVAAAVIWYVSDKLSQENNKFVFSLFLTSIFVTPFFIQNAAYQFDSFTMVLATALCVLSFFIYDEKRKVSLVCSVVLLVSSLCLYQPCANIFITLVAGNSVYKYAKISNIKSLLVFLSSYFLYFILISYFFKMNSGRASYIDPSDIIKSFMSSLEKVYFYFGLVGKLYEFIVLLGAACFLFCYLVSIIKSRSEGVINILFIILSPVAILLSMTGPAFLLREGITDVRVLSGLSASIALFIYSFYKAFNKNTYTTFVSVILFFSLSTSFLFSNAIKEQRKYEEFVISLAANDLSKIDFKGYVYAYGDIYDSRITGKILSANKFIRQIYSPAVPWISISIMQQYNIKNVALYNNVVKSRKLSMVCGSKSEPLISSRYYSIFKYKDDIVIYYGINPCK